MTSKAQTNAESRSIVIVALPRFSALGRPGVLYHGPHPRQVGLTHVPLGENLSDHLAGVAAKEITNHSRDRLSPHVELAHPRPIDERPTVGTMRDQRSRALHCQLIFRRRGFALVPQDAHDRQLEIAQFGSRCHAPNYNCRSNDVKPWGAATCRLPTTQRPDAVARLAMARATDRAAARPLPIAPVTVPFRPSASAPSPASHKVLSMGRASSFAPLEPPTSG